MMESFSEEREVNIPPPLTPKERILAQRNIIALYEKTTEDERRKMVEENSGPFRLLEADPEVRRLIREGNIKEVARRLEVLKQELKQRDKKEVA